jgi:hypothetical protein
MQPRENTSQHNQSSSSSANAKSNLDIAPIRQARNDKPTPISITKSNKNDVNESKDLHAKTLSTFKSPNPNGIMETSTNKIANHNVISDFTPITEPDQVARVEAEPKTKGATKFNAKAYQKMAVELESARGLIIPTPREEADLPATK